ncbi:MAG: 5-(carboxyamino)imidazole ribonucleotide mutase [Nitrospinaceae bacterium]|nr:5-(carboxyamino)imidazole ribonucleotide mutase [Nitrospinaceae bacterium]MDP6712106.1 5-(carboxyamino)imidazole ribonucleotide mutase [Nitrospinaceae bacterium]MDP7057136.1 5-(carboxyamino)imidazole ribonucleotide mutase [Nitrospinaceae bacterium]HAK36710.1 5-(carboxyamino)imidazole ribonucleotide mutase [Nitrospina sp.]
MSKPLVGILMGSDSDFPIMEETSKVLEKFGVAHEITVSSAHRSPERTRKYTLGAPKRGIKILVAGAGAAAHLAGVIAAETTLPVIGVPIGSSALNGLDALLSTTQMPGGVSVAGMAIGKAGAKNAGVLAVQILALSDKNLHKKLVKYKKDQAKEVERKSRKLKSDHAGNT